MKKLLLIASVLFATSAFAEKVGVVDSQRAFFQFSETKKAQQSLESQAKKVENEARQKEVALQKEYVALQAKGDKLTDAEIKDFIDRKELNYEDSLIYAYIKGLLNGFNYEGNIKQVIIDEAQDYNLLQYIIIKNIFKKASFTILGDINQNINPYYEYKSLEELTNIFEDSIYIELTKTYRSTEKIVEYTNKILNLNHTAAIRKDNQKDVIIRKNIDNLKKILIEDINYLSKYNKTAIITKDYDEASKLYELLKDEYDISLLDYDTKRFNKNLVITPAYTAKGLEFDSVIVYNNRENSYKKNEKKLLYVACTRAQHELIIYN